MLFSRKTSEVERSPRNEEWSLSISLSHMITDVSQASTRKKKKNCYAVLCRKTFSCITHVKDTFQPENCERGRIYYSTSEECS